MAGMSGRASGVGRAQCLYIIMICSCHYSVCEQGVHTCSLVPRPHPKRRKGSGDIGANSWFCKLSNHVIICIGLYWSTCSHVIVRKTKKRPAMSPDPFLACMVGSGNETNIHAVEGGELSWHIIILENNNRVGMHKHYRMMLAF